MLLNHTTKAKRHNLTFKRLTISDTTKHVHKLHPYKGKYIPQLVETLINQTTIKGGGVILDPFVGSGTTLVQSNELGFESLGIDNSKLNIQISNAKISNYNFKTLENDAAKILLGLTNKKFYKSKHYNKNLWFTPLVRKQINFTYMQIQEITNKKNRALLEIVLSRTIRSSLATKHTDYVTTKMRQHKPYYCKKHNKLCSPPKSIMPRFQHYLLDTIARLKHFDAIRLSYSSKAVQGDTRSINLNKHLKNKKVNLMITSPPYVGQINYHRQFIHAQKLLKLDGFENLEIGPLYRGRKIGAQKRYVKEMTDAFLNIKKYLHQNTKIIIIANDRFRLFPKIFKQSGLRITAKQTRQVHRRNEGDQAKYTESIFHLKVL